MQGWCSLLDRFMDGNLWMRGGVNANMRTIVQRQRFEEKNCTSLFIIMFITGRGVNIGSLNVDSDDDFFDGDDGGDGDGDDAGSSQQLKL